MLRLKCVVKGPRFQVWVPTAMAAAASLFLSDSPPTASPVRVASPDFGSPKVVASSRSRLKVQRLRTLTYGVGSRLRRLGLKLRV